MATRLLSIPQAVTQVLKEKKYLSLFLILAGIFFWLFLAIPVKTIPGNDFAFQLSLLTKKDFFLLATLSLLASLAIVMNLYILTKKASLGTGTAVFGQAGVGSVSGLIASVFGTATCSLCVASLFGFLGIGAVFFLLKWRLLVIAFAIILMIVSLYFTSLRVLGVCRECGIATKKP